MEKKRKKKFRRKIKFSSLFLLILSFSSVTFAWFLYSTKVESGVTAHIKAWNVEFEMGEEEITDEVEFEIDDLYPGMTTYTQMVSLTNSGETYASVSADIIKANIMGTLYDTENSSVTPAQLKQSLLYDYPFVIQCTVNKNRIAPGESANFTLSVVWPYESSKGDTVDTFWGDQSYQYHQTNPTAPCIELTVQITATQINS